MRSLVNFYACSNLKATDAFYKTLGLVIYHSSKGCNIYDSGYGYVGFIEKPDVILPDYHCLSFNCESVAEVDDVYLQLKDVYQCTIPAKHEKFPVYSFFLKDPDGYNLEFQYILDSEAL
jgi:predicted lactoylglutathione lyase